MKKKVKQMTHKMIADRKYITVTYYPNFCTKCGHDTFKICTEVPQEAVQAVDQMNMIQCAMCGESLD